MNIIMNALNIAILSKHMAIVVTMAKQQVIRNSVHEKQRLDYAEACLQLVHVEISC